MKVSRQQLESLYNKVRPVGAKMRDLCGRNPEFMSLEPLPPEFILQEQLEFEDLEGPSTISNDLASSIAETLTFCSNLSRVDTFRVMYKEVFQKRAKHAPLATLAEDRDEAEEWYYIEDKGERIFGPFNTEDMDQRFKWGVLREKTLVKTKFDEDYKPLAAYVKRYVMKILNDREEPAKSPKRISNKIARFRKGEELAQQSVPVEVFERRNREERVFSHLTRPNFAELPRFVLDGDLAEEEPVGRINRTRATTLQPYTPCA